MSANKFVLKGSGVEVLHDRRQLCYSRTGVH